MQNEIERRLSRIRVYSFTIQDRARHIPLSEYRSQTPIFKQILDTLSTSWSIQYESGLWVMATPKFNSIESKMPSAGYKIHISSYFKNALSILKTILPILQKKQVPFKVLVDEYMLNYSNSSLIPKASASKFITIYPLNTEEFITLVKTLHKYTKKYRGPRIIGDQRYKNNQVLFYRYGGFARATTLNVFGEKLPILGHKKLGKTILDKRTNYYRLPEEIKDPFGYPSQQNYTKGDTLIIRNRYKLLNVISTSAKGGVFRCLDTLTERFVIVKYGRPHIMANRQYPFDCTDFIKNEYKILLRLSDTMCTPRPLEIFKEQSHYFLVIEEIQGNLLSQEIAQINLFEQLSCSEQHRRLQNILMLMKKIILAVKKIHQRKVVIGDIAPQNIIIEKNTSMVKLIDFESAVITTRKDFVNTPLGTVGISQRSNYTTKPSVQNDLPSLANLLIGIIAPLTSLFALHPSIKESFLKTFLADRNLPAEKFLQIFRVTRKNLDEALKQIEGLMLACSSRRLVKKKKLSHFSHFDKERIGKWIHGISCFITTTLRNNKPLPFDYRGLNTNPLGLSYGFSGLAYFIFNAIGYLTKEVEDMLIGLHQEIQPKEYPPGVSVGLSGIAFVMNELGYTKEAEKSLKMAATSDLLEDSADLFYGLAGFGIVQLSFYKKTENPAHLKVAISVAYKICRHHLIRDKDGLFYKNVDGKIYHGLGHGSAGISLFFLRLYQVTGEAQYISTATQLIEWEIANRKNSKGLQWSRHKESKTLWPYFRIGAVGIALVLLRFYDVLGDKRYLELSEIIAQDLRGIYSVSHSRYSGMAGIGELFLELHSRTNNAMYYSEALAFAKKTSLFGIKTSSGIVFPCSEALRMNVDIATGSSGVGLFYLRLISKVSYNFFDVGF